MQYEEHEVRSLKYPKPFVSFVNFVVQISVLKRS